MSTKQITNWFGSRFVKGFARNIINNWEIAIVELIANCYDAGARNVYITIGNDEERNFIISDDGNGMTKEEFIFRWSGIGYDREKYQGNEVCFPNYLKYKGKIGEGGGEVEVEGIFKDEICGNCKKKNHFRPINDTKNLFQCLYCSFYNVKQEDR